MTFQPVTILITLLGGLVLAGILGWVRNPRLIIFVPRLFSHSQISDKGQIVEISVINRGFKTEEKIELSLNPHLHYELIGSNNPDAKLNGSKLSIPRIGSSDDCSVLIQADNGKFSHEDIINCLSKDSKGKFTKKLEDIPLTAQQRVGLVSFFSFLLIAGLLAFKGIDKIFEVSNEETNIEAKQNPIAKPSPEDLQGWKIPGIYKNSEIYKKIIEKELQINMGKLIRRGNTISIPISLKNDTDQAIELRASTSSPVDDSNIRFDRRVLTSRLILPKGSIDYTLQAAIGNTDAQKFAQIEIFLDSDEYSPLKATRLVSAEQ